MCVCVRGYIRAGEMTGTALEPTVAATDKLFTPRASTTINDYCGVNNCDDQSRRVYFDAALIRATMFLCDVFELEIRLGILSKCNGGFDSVIVVVVFSYCSSFDRNTLWLQLRCHNYVSSNGEKINEEHTCNRYIR